MKQEPCPVELTLYQNVKRSALSYPRNVALRYFKHSYSYKHLLKRINQFAAALRSLGIKENEPVTICLPNIPDAVYLLYAVNQIGAIANIVHPLFTFEQMKEVLELTKSKYVFVLDVNYKKFVDLMGKDVKFFSCCPANEFTKLSRVIYRRKNKGKLVKNERTIDKFYHFKTDTAECTLENSYKRDSVYLHSGGTTGKPKTIALSDYAINSVVCNVQWITGKDSLSKSSMLSALPMFHGFGLAMAIHCMLVYGGTDVLMPKFTRKHTVDYIKKGQLEFLIGVPVLYEALLSKPNFRGRKLRSISAAYVGGDYVSPALKERFNMRMQKAGSECIMREGYGLTEVVNVCSVNGAYSYKPGTVGRILPNLKWTVLDENLNELAPDQDGEICIGGPTVMNGYRFINDDSLNSVFYVGKDGTKYVRTGDFGSIDSEGYITYKQRIKQLVKVNGVPVFPSQIEDCATSFNFVYETCAIGIEDEKHGHIIKLYVMLSKTYKGTKEDAEKKLIERIVSRLGVYSKPKEIVFIDKMPHTPIGKIDYKLLK